MRIKCYVSLSNKLRSLIKEGSPVTISIKGIEDGKARASINFEENNSAREQAEKLIGQETSIIIRCLEWDIMTPSPKSDETIEDRTIEENSVLETTTPEENIAAKNVSENQPIGAIFSYDAPNNDSHPIIKKIAATKAPRTQAEIASTFSKDIKTPEPLSAMDNPALKKFIADPESFYKIVAQNKNKKSSIDPTTITNIRERAVAEEKRQLEESIGIPSYVVNEKYASLQINDLNISLPKNCPLDLSRYSANKLYASKDLSSLINSKMIRFVNPVEAQNIIEKALTPKSDNDDIEEVEESRTHIFSSHRKAQESTENNSEETGTEIDLETDINSETEQEKLAGLVDLTPMSNSGVKRTVRSNSDVTKRPELAPKADKIQHKTINRL